MNSDDSIKAQDALKLKEICYGRSYNSISFIINRTKLSHYTKEFNKLERIYHAFIYIYKNVYSVFPSKNIKLKNKTFDSSHPFD